MLLFRSTSGKKGLSMSGLRRAGDSGIKNSNVRGSGVKSGSKVLTYSSRKNQGEFRDY